MEPEVGLDTRPTAVPSTANGVTHRKQPGTDPPNPRDGVQGSAGEPTLAKDPPQQQGSAGGLPGAQGSAPALVKDPPQQQRQASEEREGAAGSLVAAKDPHQLEAGKETTTERGNGGTLESPSLPHDGAGGASTDVDADGAMDTDVDADVDAVSDAAAAAAGGGVGGGDAAGAGRKSSYRGVCWNKTNKRWQTEIKKEGKRLHLGSFAGEEEAARAFDRAAIHLRGNKTVLNFELADYLDAQGQFVEDPKLTPLLTKFETMCKYGKEPVAGPPCVGGINFFAGLRPPPSGKVSYHTSAISGLPSISSGSGAFTHPNPQPLQLQPQPRPAPPQPQLQPPSSAAAAPPPPPSLPPTGAEDLFGMVYENTSQAAGSSAPCIGSAVWDGSMVHDLGTYELEKDARQACVASMRVVMHFKRQKQ